MHDGSASIVGVRTPLQNLNKTGFFSGIIRFAVYLNLSADIQENAQGIPGSNKNTGFNMLASFSTFLGFRT